MQSPPPSATAELQQLLSVAPAGFVIGGGNNNPHAIAHAALQALRDAGDERFLFLRTILELHNHQAAASASSSSCPRTNEELLFHCLTGCRHVMLHKWYTCAPVFRDAVRDYLLSWAVSDAVALPRTVEMACYTAVASFWKRQWNETEGNNTNTKNNAILRPEEQALINTMRQQQQQVVLQLASKQDLFQYLKALLLEDSSHKRRTLQASTFLSVLIGEFMGKSAVQYHLPLEFHRQAHASFEREGWLDQCLQLSMGALSHIVSHMTTEQQSFTTTREDGNVALAVVQLTTEVIGWEFGSTTTSSDAWDSSGMSLPASSGKTLVRPPATWREYLIRPDFVQAMFHMHELVVASRGQHTHESAAHALRQLLLLLASLTGPIFADEGQRKAYATYLVDGTFMLLSSSMSRDVRETSQLLDVFSLISRLIANFKLSTLVQLPTLVPLLDAITSAGTALIHANVKECEAVQGDVERMEHREWREEALILLLDGLVLLCGDPWLLYSGTEETRQNARASLAQSLGPLYSVFITSRIHMAKLEERYLTMHAAELDEVREEISASDLEEEMESLAVLGRLNLSSSLDGLSSLFQAAAQELRLLWEAKDATEVSPEGAAVLEETRLLTLILGHLITDDNSGETPLIPDAVVASCRGNPAMTSAISSAVQSVLSIAELQASRIAVNPSDPRLSPLLATAFLWFLNRWAPAYVDPVDYSATSYVDAAPSQILSAWADEGSSQHIVTFCTTLCLHYQCYWPQERLVQSGAHSLLLSLGRRGQKIRSRFVSSPSLTKMVTMHCLTAGLRHNAPPSELEATVQSKAPGMLQSINMFHGYQRLRYDDRSRILTTLLIATCDKTQEAQAMFNECLNSIQSSFSFLVQALNKRQVAPTDVNAQEMACLCVEMYGGVARASEMEEPERIPAFLTPSLPHLSGLMSFYANDLSICEALLRLFRDYAEQFISMLDRDQSLALFNASAELLKSYSSNHCSSSRVIQRAVTSSAEADAEEEQKYSDVLCAIDLLIHLGTKDFLNLCTSGNQEGNIGSNEVTDVIFYGLQQIIPLMTQGLLQFPTLCTSYFSLVGFMMDTYPDKVCVLPYHLFSALLESLLFGMSHLDQMVSKNSLHGIAGLVREHLKTRALDQHLTAHPDIIDKCSSRLLKDVVFQSIVWDRLEASGMALLPLAAVDVARFATVVHELTQQVPAEHQPRLQAAFEGLLQPEVIAKVSNGGYEGRMNRICFKRKFEEFVKDVHSFLVLR